MTSTAPTWPSGYRDPDDPISPAPAYRQLRAQAPVFRGGSGRPSLVSGYAEVRELLGQRSLSTAFGGPDNVSGQPGFLLSMDPPDHSRLRRLLTRDFSMRRITAMRPWLEQTCTQLLDAMAAAGPPADLMAGFAIPLPSLVICELLGVPYADRADFQRRSDTLVSGSATPAQHRENAAAMHAYMRALVRRHRQDPGADILGMLIRDHGQEVSEDELVGIGNILLIAGHETTANTIGLGTLLLLDHPDQLARLRAEPAELIVSAVEEVLRYTSIVESGTPRIVTADLTVGGQLIPAGEVVVVALPSANRDPALVEQPDVFDITRRPTAHLAFGHGIHQCLGQQLARLEMAVALPALLARFPGLALIEGKPPVFRVDAAVNGLRSLPLAW